MKPLSYEPVAHRQYGLPHGASNPQQAALLNQKHMAEQQNKLITGGRKRTKRQSKRNTRRTTRKRRRTEKSCICMCPACRRCQYRKSTKRRSRKRSYKGGNKIIVPHFNEPSNPASPDGPNTQARNLNSTYLQGKSNAEYDHMHNASPRTVDSF